MRLNDHKRTCALLVANPYVCDTTVQKKGSLRHHVPEQRHQPGDAQACPAGKRFATSNTGATWGLEGDKEVDLDESKVQAALQKLREQDQAAAAGVASSSGYHGLAGDTASVSAEEMEAYRRHRGRANDPMQQMAAGEGGAADGFDMV